MGLTIKHFFVLKKKNLFEHYFFLFLYTYLKWWKGLVLKDFKMQNKDLRHLHITPLEHIPSLTFTEIVWMNLVYTLPFSQSNPASVREDIFSRDYVHKCRKMLFGVLKPFKTKPFGKLSLLMPQLQIQHKAA